MMYLLPALGLGAAAYFAILGVALFFNFIAYVCISFVFHSLARRRGIKHGWLSWLPIGQSWIMGSIADDYNYRSNHKVTSHGREMTWLTVALSVLGVWSMLLSFLETGFATIGMVLNLNFEVMEMLTGLIPLVALAVGIFSLILSIWLLVEYYVALHDVFRSCNPKIAPVCTLCSVLLGTWAMIVCLFILFTKDYGMTE